MSGIDVHDYAANVVAVIASDGDGPAFIAGHAFGNRMAGMLATARPDLLSGITLIATNIGIAPSPPKVREAIRESANPSLPDSNRLEALRFASFAPGNEVTSWLTGWYPEVLAVQRIADDRTPRSKERAAGHLLAHAEDAETYKEMLDDRLAVVAIPHSNHAVIAEQPDATSAVIDFMRRLPG